ncbi:MAG: S4 domain-containing protein YaaA [Bacilli bacterium]|nr:S4 domain-containing protein YaaA [Bacilli bacterium]
MNKKTHTITLKTEFITLGQVLKLSRVVSTGGEVKAYLASNKVLVNQSEENRRGRKLYKGDVVELEGDKILLK